MKTIYKYPLIVGGENIIGMPSGAKVLDVQSQRGELVLWAIVDLQNPFEARHFDVIGTGFSLPDEADQYIASVQLGPLVWHVFELKGQS